MRNNPFEISLKWENLDLATDQLHAGLMYSFIMQQKRTAVQYQEAAMFDLSGIYLASKNVNLVYTS